MTQRTRALTALLLTTAVLASLAPAAASTPRLRIVSVNSREQPANDHSYNVGVSRNGRYVVFESWGTNLPGAQRDLTNVYLRDRRSGRTRLAARSSSGEAANGAGDPAISPNGRFVAFCSLDPELVQPDSLWHEYPTPDHHPDTDVYVRDLHRGVTRRASTSRTGGEANDYSCGASVADNGDVAFLSLASDLTRGDRNDRWDAYLYDWSSRRVRMLSRRPAERQLGDVQDVTVSGNSRRVAVLTSAALKAGDTNNVSDVYLLNRRTDRWSRAVRRSSGKQIRWPCEPGALDLSHTGRYLLADCRDGRIMSPPVPHDRRYLILLDRRTDRRRVINRTDHADSHQHPLQGAALSDDGSTVVFNTSGEGYDGRVEPHHPWQDDVFLWRRGTATVRLTPGIDTWSSGGPALSGDGRFAGVTSNSPGISGSDPDDERQEIYLTTPLR